METAIQQRDFETFAKVTMTDSNSFHACCLDTFPPIFYLNDVSRAAIRAVEDINQAAGKTVAAYTFDAGPNAVIYYEEKNTAAVAGVLKSVLGHVDGWQAKNVTAQDASIIDAKAVQTLKDGVSRVILTSVGEGPVKTQESLISENGEPIRK
ncbi:Diphosphomevalonate decarboxylase, partial [Scytalidium lignicola]